MIVEKNYRSCVKASLSIMHEQRGTLFLDCINRNPTVFNGLYESEHTSVRNLYFQSYFMTWLDSHWELMNVWINKQQNYTKDRKTEMILFFADYFSKLISECDNNVTLSKLTIPDLLKNKKKAFDEMLLAAENCDINNDRIRVEMKCNHEKFKKMIKEYESEEL